MRRSDPPARRVHADFLLIGGGIAAATAAQTLRDEGAAGSIVMLCGESFYPYNRPDLTGGILMGDLTADKILVRQPRDYAEDQIDVRLGTIVRSVDPAHHRVVDHRGDEYTYGKLLIATGAEARRLDVPGADLQGIFRLHSLTDAMALHHAASRRSRAVIVGSSFVAMEVASSLTRLGLDVTLIDQSETVFPKIRSPDLAAYFRTRCEEHGIAVKLGQSIVAFRGTERVAEVVTSAGDTLPCEMVVLAIGVAPELGFLAGSGIAIGDGILVDEFLGTNFADVFAAGDAANYADRNGHRQRVAHWDNARNQGRLAARNMLGRRIPYEDVPHYFCDFLDFSFTFLGTSEEAERRIGRGDIRIPSFAEFYLSQDRIIGLFSTGRPAEETNTVEMLIRQRARVGDATRELADPGADLGVLARATVLILQGGGVLGAFECGVIRALEEEGIFPSIVGGISVGALNGAIVAAHPGNASKALDAFWNDLSLDTAGLATPYIANVFAVWRAIALGIPGFFEPRWLAPPLRGEELPQQWTSLYDAEPLKALLRKYVDFTRLAISPVRLIVGAVDVELGELKFFDTRVDKLTADHIVASCSLPPILPWTTINGHHYWDGGIISNSPLDHVLSTTGADNKDVVIVDLFPGRRPLPTSLPEVITRRDEITYGERIRNDAEVRELVHDFQALVGEIMLAVDPETAERLKQRPRYVHLMGRGAETSIIRIVRESHGQQAAGTDYDFSAQTIARHKAHGYRTARKLLRSRRPALPKAADPIVVGSAGAVAAENPQQTVRR